MSRKEERRGLIIIEDCVDASIQGFEEYIKKTKKDELQKPIIASVTWEQKEKLEKLENKNWKKSTACKVLATNVRDSSWKNLDIALKRKPK